MSAANQTTMLSASGTNRFLDPRKTTNTFSLVASDSASSSFQQFSDIYKHRSYKKKRQSTLW